MLGSLCLVACALAALHVCLRVSTRRARAALAHLPCYPQLPFLGNMLEFRKGGNAVLPVMNKLLKICDEKKLPFVLWLSYVPAIIFQDPEEVRIVTNSFIEKPYYYRFACDFVGEGLVTAPGMLWKRSIKKLSGVFSTAVVQGYQPVFEAQARALVGRLRSRAGGAPFDALHDIASTTLQAVCPLGVTSTDIVEQDRYHSSLNRAFELMATRGLNLLTHPEWLFKLTPAHAELTKEVAVLHNVSETAFKKRQLERLNNNSKMASTTDVKFRSVIDLLMEIGETDPHFSEQQIKSEVDTIILGGQETVAVTLNNLLLMLGCKPDVQNKLYEEVRSIFGSSRRSLEAEDFARLEYCEAVINETLRLFPPVPLTMRYADKELKLKSCTIPAGCAIMINAWGAGRSAHNWGPDALEFRPERWLGDLPHAAAFLPFSYGRRSCIGKKYAMKILKTVVAYSVRDLEFTSNADELDFKFNVTLCPIAGNLLQVKLRN